MHNAAHEIMLIVLEHLVDKGKQLQVSDED